MRLMLRAGLPAVASFAACVFAWQPAVAQDERGIGTDRRDEGVLEIIEPAAWRDVETRGIGVGIRDAVRVVGRAFHPSGVNGVLINGDRAAIQTLGDGMVRFIGYVRVEHGMKDVEIAAFTNDGRSFIQRYPLEARPTERVYEEPEAAWAPENGFRGKRWAVVVGISEYADTRVTPLRFADRDARSFYEFLTSERAGLGGFPRENVVLLLNRDATYRNLRTALFSFLKEATEDDQVVIYFAGHGVPDPERIQNLYLMTSDARVDNLSGTAFPMADVAEATRNILARDIVVITDACHSAGVGGQVAAMRDVSANQINRLFLHELSASAGGLTIFTASQAAQVSFEGEQWGGGHGIFTHYLLEGLNGAADDDQDRIVTLVEMMEYTREKVRRETRNAQIPTISQTTFDQALPMAAVLDPTVYERLAEEEAAGERVALPSMFAVPESAAPVRFYDPTSAFLRGLVVPGAGMWYLDRPGAGALYAIGAVATAAGVVIATNGMQDLWTQDIRPEQPCWEVIDGEPCVEGPWYTNDAITYPMAIGAGFAVWLTGAIHARAVAKRLNTEAEAMRRGSVDAPPRLHGPRFAVGGTSLGIEILRISF